VAQDVLPETVTRRSPLVPYLHKHPLDVHGGGTRWHGLVHLSTHSALRVDAQGSPEAAKLYVVILPIWGALSKCMSGDISQKERQSRQSAIVLA
jgi:hypothetical protein